MKIRSALISFALVIVANSSVFAQDSDRGLQRVVQFGDLNLATEAGRSRLSGRLEGAVRAVCPVEDFSGLEAGMRRRECVKVARASYEAQTGRAIAAASPRVQQIADARPAH